MTPQTGTDQQVRRWTIQADGPDGAVPHFYADTDLAEVEVLEAAPLLALLSGLADRWEERHENLKAAVDDLRSLLASLEENNE
jgi:hypothetical protein